MRTLLTTVGASLLTNAARTLRKEPNQLTDPEHANCLRTAPPRENSLNVALVVSFWPKTGPCRKDARSIME